MAQLEILTMKFVALLEKSHLDSDATVERIGVGYGQQPYRSRPQTFSDLPQHSDRIIHMLEDMIAQQHIKGLLRMKVFEKRMHYLVSIRRIIRFIDHLLASFDYQQALKQVGHPLGNVAIPEPQL
jgi:hypothetical protein